VLLQVLDAQSVQSGLNAGTNIGDAMAEGVIRLTSTSENQKKVMILLSDGEHNKLGSETLMPFQAAQLAAKFAIPIYTIDCGGEPDPQAKPEEFKQRTDGRAVLQGVAELTNARSFVANSGADLQAVYQQIDQLERVQVQSDRFRRYQDYRPSCGILALGVLLLLLSLERTVWQRFPA
jgi:Ca-activated chloride channel family protein